MKIEEYTVREDFSKIKNNPIGKMLMTMEVVEGIIPKDEKIRMRSTWWKLKCSKCGWENFLKGQDIQKGGSYCHECGTHPNKKYTVNIKDSSGNFTRLYRIFMGIKQRCLDTNYHSYGNYGGRGIAVCSEWLNNYEAFYEWATSNGYSDELSIDRIDVDGNYEPSNCRWATAKEQANNRTSNRLIEHNGEMYTMQQLADKLELSHEALGYRIANGIEVDSKKRKYDRLMIFDYSDSEEGCEIQLSNFCKKNNYNYARIKYHYIKNKDLEKRELYDAIIKSIDDYNKANKAN